MKRHQAEHSTLTDSLLRPFVDLEPCERGPLCARGIEHYWDAFLNTSQPRFRLQRVLTRHFRRQLLSEAGLFEYDVEDPREVSPAIRSTRWTRLCDAIDHWPELTTDHQCRLVLVLHALCFYALISQLTADLPEAAVIAHADHAELAYRRASARYVLQLPSRVADYWNADLSDLERIATTASCNQSVALNAAMMVLVHKAKVGAPADELVEWETRSHRLLESVLPECDDFASALLSSRFYRAAAFVPQRSGDRGQVVRLMDLAEHLAQALVPANKAQELLRLENLYPVIESRTKEALWLGDMDLALLRAKRLIELDPYDSRAWLELGQVRMKRNECALAAEAYASAAMLGPPSSAIGHHMAGLCFRKVGQPLLAAFFFKSAVKIDSSAISPHDEIQELPELPVLAVLKDWSLRSFEA